MRTKPISTIPCVNCKSHKVSDVSKNWYSAGTLRFWCVVCPIKCQVYRCTSCNPDETHYCKYCNNSNARHREYDCVHNPIINVNKY